MKSGIRVAVAGLAALAAGLLTSVTATAQAATPTYTTISKQSAADPGFSKFGSSYYVYATGGGDGILPIFRGSSLTKGFTKVGNAYTSAPAGLNNLWAPHVVARDGRFFMFFTAAAVTARGARRSLPTPAVPSVSLTTCGRPASRRLRQRARVSSASPPSPGQAASPTSPRASVK